MLRRLNPTSLKYLILIIAGFFITSQACAFSEIKDDGIEIKISPNHESWNYKVGEEVTFKIQVLEDNKPIPMSRVSITIGPEKMPPTFKEEKELRDGEIEIDGGTMQNPGFLRCIVSFTKNGKEYRNLATAAFEPFKIKPTTDKPTDFHEFWEKAKAEASKVPMDARLTRLEESSTPTVDVYEVNLQSYLPGNRLFGILCVPKKEGTYPAVLKLPGAGVRSYDGEIKLAEKGIITLEIGIHGIPQNLKKEVYYDLAFGALRNYYFQNLDNRDTYYYKKVYLGCIRAIDFICSIDKFNGQQLATYGGSQGGALSLVTAALDSRVKYMVCLFPAMSDLTGYLHGRAGGWPHLFNKENAKFNLTENKIENSKYFDLVNFASLIKIPGLYSWGYNDEVCPPTSVFSAYNKIKAPKELKIFKSSGHWESPAQRKLLEDWLLKQFKSKS